MNNLLIVHIFVVLILSEGVTLAEELMERDAFNIHLAILVAYTDSKTGKLNDVMIKYGNQMEAWTISPTDDFYIKDTPNKTREHRHIERLGLSRMITPFENKQIQKVTKTFIKTLEKFEIDLKREKWGACLYLDGRFPLFLHSFYYLLSAATNSDSYFPKEALVPKTLFDDSFYSKKSDNRIKSWMNDKERVTKLRIASKELSFQLNNWMEKQLKSPNPDDASRRSIDMINAFTLFIKLYFGK